MDRGDGDVDEPTDEHRDHQAQRDLRAEMKFVQTGKHQPAKQKRREDRQDQKQEQGYKRGHIKLPNPSLALGISLRLDLSKERVSASDSDGGRATGTW